MIRPVCRKLIGSKFWQTQFFSPRFCHQVTHQKTPSTWRTTLDLFNSRNLHVSSRILQTETTKSESKTETANDDKKIDAANKKEDKSTIVSKMKTYMLKRRDYTKKYTDNNTITAVRAMQEYILPPSDLEELRQIRVRSPYASNAPIHVYLERDVEKKAIEVWGSKEALERERKRLKRLEVKRRQKLQFPMSQSDNGPVMSQYKGLLSGGPGRVVAFAAAANGLICFFKLGCFVSTGSASMFSETLHSLADTCNQLLLLWGINESLKKADEEHPYGFGNMRHIMSLISGVGIFCIGCGASIYHGIQVLLHPASGLEIGNLMSFSILLGAAVMESASLALAVNETRRNAKKYELSFWEYVKESRDPSTNVVLLEDSAAVMGVGIAGSAIALTYYTGNILFDAVGSIMIGGLLGGVATFLVTSNANALIGRSIPPSRLEELQEMLEDDAVIRGVYDVKATQLSSEEFKFKAEIDFDGREITRAYLASVDMENMLREIHAVQTLEELEILISRYGEHVIDTLGVHVDRIESELKKKNPDLRHIDLEVL
ncbi:proton-coupled zinc antiporter SLC30A9, mitochondrial-like [Ciona intestinalis]